MVRVRVFFVLGALLVAATASADGTLYGLRNPGDFGRQLITVDPATAAVGPVSGSIDPPNATQPGQVALDSVGGRFFFVGTPGVETSQRIYTLDAATGAVLSNPSITGGTLLTLEYDDDSATLYALINPGDGGKQLVLLDENTGSITPISASISPSLGVTLGVHAIDTDGNRFFFGGTPSLETGQRLFTVDTQTGALLGSPSIIGGDLLAIEYDDDEDVLYGLRNPGDGGKQLVTVDPLTGAVVAVSASIDPTTFIAAGVDALDAAGNRFFYIGIQNPGDDFKLYTIATDTGALLGSPVIAGTNAAGITGFRYPKAPVPPPVVEVVVDVRSTINVRSRGVIPVAILTTPAFDATTVDPLSVQFGPGNASEAHGTGHISDVDGDGDLDLLLHFRTQDAAIPCGATSASLTGETFGGQAIEGSDTVQTVGCP